MYNPFTPFPKVYLCLLRNSDYTLSMLCEFAVNCVFRPWGEIDQSLSCLIKSAGFLKGSRFAEATPRRGCAATALFNSQSSLLNYLQLPSFAVNNEANLHLTFCFSSVGR